MIALEVADWRRRVHALYTRVRETPDAAAAHAIWKSGRDDLFATHPSTPLLPEGRPSFTGLPITDYDPAWRFELEIVPGEERHMDVETGTDGVVPFELLGSVTVPEVGSLDIWRLSSYGGGIFVPVKDLLHGKHGGTYGGGRYLLDTVKGADLGREGPDGSAWVIDLNFSYNPSCAYDPAWACPLAPLGNRVSAEVPVGELTPTTAG